MRRRVTASGVVAAGLLVGLTLAGCGGESASLDSLIADHRLAPLTIEPAPGAQFTLGEALFYDPILSGNRNISCATCHHPSFASGDGLSLSIGQGGDGLGRQRRTGDGGVIPRNATDLYNRGATEWVTMFWDGRVAGSAGEGFTTPAGEALPPGLDSVLAAQAMFPVESHGEMRGNPGDYGADGKINELSYHADDDFVSVWDGLMARLVAIAEYRDLFAAAYPDVPAGELGFEHAANAIAAYEATAFAFTNSPWSRYLAGETTALGDDAARGAALFLGDAGCSACHSGSLLTDQQFHSLGVPQIGPGKEDEAPEDFGRGRETGIAADRYAFRTPSLHNVALTGPWMHDGAFATLEAVIRHHVDPERSLAAYDVGQTIGPGLPFIDRRRYLDPLLASVTAELDAVPELSDEQIADLVAFLHALTDPAAANLDHLVPEDVPSGLPIER
jgi:cytochrome c peroxidase